VILSQGRDRQTAELRVIFTMVILLEGRDEETKDGATLTELELDWLGVFGDHDDKATDCDEAAAP
jgi:hypothetical protein